MEYQIRSLAPDDKEACLLILKENYSNQQYENDAIESMNEMFNKEAWITPEFYVMEQNNKIVAFGAICNAVCDFDVWTGFWVNVKKEFQRIGYGMLLAKYLIEKVREKDADIIIMTCKKHNRVFYEKLGFKLLFERRDGLLMGLHFYPQLKTD